MNDIIAENIIDTSFLIPTSTVPEQFYIDQVINDSRSVIFLAKSQSQKKLAAKFFLDSADISYYNESRFLGLTHENIIKFVHKIDKHQVNLGGSIMKSSLIFMELALCDLRQVISSITLDSKLVRTFFHHIVQGVEHIHSKGIYHMDIKLDNILLGSDFKLKLADFEFAYKKNDLMHLGEGTENIRAPEVKTKECRNPAAADIYSMGIVLFSLKLRHLPYNEDQPVNGYDLQRIMFDNPSFFWKTIASFHKGHCGSEKFRKLFEGMTREDPSKRITLKEIKKSEWYNKPIYSSEELKLMLKDEISVTF